MRGMWRGYGSLFPHPFDPVNNLILRQVVPAFKCMKAGNDGGLHRYVLLRHAVQQVQFLV